MKKERTIWGRLAAFLLCVLLLGSMIPEGSKKASAAQSGAKIAGFSLTVTEGTLGLNIFFSGVTSGQTKAVVDSVEHTLTAENGYYKATHQIDAKDTAKNLVISLKSGSTKIALTNSGATNGTVSYSVKEYLSEIKKQNNTGGRLAKAIDDYGDCAKYYFNGASSIPVTISDVNLEPYRMQMIGTVPESVFYNGSSLVLTDTFSIRHYFFLTRNASDYTFRVDGKAVSLQKKDDLYYVEIPGITAGNIDHVYETTLTLDGVSSTFRYSVLSYADIVTALSGDAALSTLVKSIYWYNYYFRQYKNQSSSVYEEYPEDPWDPSLGYITYEMFGAKGDGVTDDYDAIVLAHEAANEQNLPVKAKNGATYYIGHMGYFLNPVNDGKSRDLNKGGVIKTATDWTGATFIIDDTVLYGDKRIIGYNKETGDPVYEDYIPYGDCYLFTVAPSKDYGRFWMNPNKFFRVGANGKIEMVSDAKVAAAGGYTRYYLGVDPDLDDYPDYRTTSGSNFSGAIAYGQKNKTFSKDTVALGAPNEFHEDAVYVLRTTKYKRWGRYSDSGVVAARDQKEVFVLDASTGCITENSRLQWDWDEIQEIWKYPIDKTPLTVKGGTFNTIVNTVRIHPYIHRGINIARSNVTIEGVEHYLLGEDACFGTGNEYVGYNSQGKEIHVPRYGAPMHGFFRVTNCANVTIKNCKLSNHLAVFSYGDDYNNTSPYEIYAEYVAGLTIDGCVCVGDEEDVSGPADPTGIMDPSRWGTTGTNFCKDLKVLNSRVNRIDAHMGTYNLTVKDSHIGYRGILAVGFGTMNIERVTSYSKYFVYLRKDYGSYWNGDINITDCVWKLDEDTLAPWLVFSSYKTNGEYGFDTITEDGETYYGTMPTTINVNGFVLDASKITNISFNNTNGFQIFSNPIDKLNFVVNDANLANRSVYKYPLRITKEVKLKRLTIIRNPAIANDEFTKGVNLRVPGGTYNESYLFRNTIFDYNPNKDLTLTVGQPWTFDWLEQ